ncbi:TrmB family transcriptional regulator [Paenibacillus thalictri]|uniref:TrmB family transcriptional regulator n=1 Tax=Paenibacillus thalictri TaxID=2527873 RepID=A0A4Q9DE50_9BACL|nr:helix-turn-helix domain-containing protein [Paenibacillus thalictri]TBL68210.1 TrmB family transcriptional regulator [Paenibacillus thalictri]
MNTIMELLTRFGFSKNEARVYLALVQEDAATGYQISKNTGISRAEVYRVLGNLADKGAVVWQQTEPALYMAVEPESFLSGLEAKFNSDLQKVRVEFKEINRQKSNETIVYVKGYDHVVRRAKQMIQSAQNEVYLRCGAPFAALLQDDISKVSSKGVKVRILSYGDFTLEGVQVVIHPLRQDEVHRHRAMQMLMISDIRQMLVGRLDSQNPDTVIGTYSESREIIHIVRELIRASFHLTILGNESDIVSSFMNNHELFQDIYKDGSIMRYD